MLHRDVIESIEELRYLIHKTILEHLDNECDGGPVELDLKFDLAGDFEIIKGVKSSEGSVVVISENGEHDLHLYSLDEMITILDEL
ncbi:MAG: hypothetical protein IKY94_11735 [Lachnospiraceae bacterium]|nr:hypothetical protein [Lachnospiraceae bacterium]